MENITEERMLKYCPKCGKLKPRSDYYKDCTRKDGLRPYCISCLKKYRNDNKERITEYNKMYRDTHKEKIQKHREEHRDDAKKYYQDHKDKLNKYSAIYQQTPKGKIAIKNTHHKRSQLKNKTAKKDQPTAEQWEKIIDSQGGRCAICKCEFMDSNLPTMDHIVPLSKGGSHSSDNLQALCVSCNSSKHDTIDYEYIQSWC